MHLGVGALGEAGLDLAHRCLFHLHTILDATYVPRTSCLSALTYIHSAHTLDALSLRHAICSIRPFT